MCDRRVTRVPLPQLFFRERVREEEGYVLLVKQNAISGLVPKYGLESTLLLPGSKQQNDAVQFVYDEQVRTHARALREDEGLAAGRGGRKPARLLPARGAVVAFPS